MTFTVEIPVRWTDLDAQGHVNNVTCVDYLQQARTRFVTSGEARGLAESGCVVTQHRIRYLRPLTFGSQPVTAKVATSAVGAATIEVAYELYQGELACRAESTLCAFDREAGRPRRLSPRERGFFERTCEQVEPISPIEIVALEGRGRELPIWTRWSDTDRFAHINNVRILDYALAGRLEMTAAAHPAMARAGQGGDGSLHWLIAGQDVIYRAQMFDHPEPYRVLTAPTRVGTSSAVIASEIVDDDGGLIAHVSAIMVSADPSGAKQAMPDDVREALTAHLVSN